MHTNTKDTHKCCGRQHKFEYKYCINASKECECELAGRIRLAHKSRRRRVSLLLARSVTDSLAPLRTPIHKYKYVYKSTNPDTHRPMQWTQKSKDMWCNATDLLDHFVFKTSSIRETYMADKDLRAGGYLRMISEKLKSRTQTKEGRSSIIRTPTITQERSDLPSGGKSNVTKPTIASHFKNHKSP